MAGSEEKKHHEKHDVLTISGLLDRNKDSLSFMVTWVFFQMWNSARVDI